MPMRLNISTNVSMVNLAVFRFTTLPFTIKAQIVKDRYAKLSVSCRRPQSGELHALAKARITAYRQSLDGIQ
ncbi:hypothetical protein CNECB9_3580001 [Cupriavidus necator]|uniref:Uncharacterized protein n=1 Tax=Cupriavidus necator TaxID=106590 RepID=A0A1K0JD31_CUPNE|nr:hypothetical protein CNECB9_3580001 [Cupriavidus necator]